MFPRRVLMFVFPLPHRVVIPLVKSRGGTSLITVQYRWNLIAGERIAVPSASVPGGPEMA